MSAKGDDVHTINLGDGLTVCPECGYTNGFHVTFVRQDDNNVKIVLVCPSCSAKFEIGWTASGP